MLWVLWQITAYSSPKSTTQSGQRVIFYYAISMNYISKDRYIMLSYGRIPTALFINQDISNFLLVNRNRIPNTTRLSTWIREGIRKYYCAREEKTLDNLVAVSLPSLRSPVNCQWNHINFLPFHSNCFPFCLDLEAFSTKNKHPGFCMYKPKWQWYKFKLGKDSETHFHTNWKNSK